MGKAKFGECAWGSHAPREATHFYTIPGDGVYGYCVFGTCDDCDGTFRLNVRRPVVSLSKSEAEALNEVLSVHDS